MAGKKNVVPSANKVEKTEDNTPVTAQSRARITQDRHPKRKFPPLTLKDSYGNELDVADYFFSDGSEAESTRLAATADATLAPVYFNKVVGLPVQDEELIEIFEKVFSPDDGFLFYKCNRKEVYVIIVPLKFSKINEEKDALSGDYQKHTISFIAEGSVNLEQLKVKLQRIAGMVHYDIRDRR